MLSRFWRPEVQIEGVSSEGRVLACFFLLLWLHMCRGLGMHHCSLCLFFTRPFLRVLSLDLGSVQATWGVITLRSLTSFHLQRPIFQINLCLQILGGCMESYVLGTHHSVIYINHIILKGCFSCGASNVVFWFYT